MLRRVALPLLFFISIAARAQIPVPAITSVTPDSGPVGIEVTITGLNFGSDPALATIRFGAVKAVITQISPTEIKTRVPIGATYRPVSVLVDKLVGFSPKPFLVTSVNESLVQAGSFSEIVSFDVGGAPYEIVAADLDIDGKPDLVVAGFVNLSVLRNTAAQGSLSASSFAPKADLATEGVSVLSAATGDIDGDGKLDVIAIGTSGSANTITVFKNNCVPGIITAASFASSTFTVGLNPQKVVIADLDKDGKPDVITANGNNSISVLHNKTNNIGITFENHVDINSTTPGTAETVAAADMDLDGKPDLVEYNFSNNVYTISVLRNQSDFGDIRQSSFALAVSFGSGLTSDSDIAIGDLDNDGRPDLLANFGTNNAISVLKNLSVPGNFNASSFATKVDFGTGTNPLCGKAIADINGDGLPDIISTNRDANTWSVLQNKAQAGVINTASFLPKVDFPTGQKPTGIAAADFDGDGMTDVAVVSRDSRTASVYRNQMADPLIASFTPQFGLAGTPLTITGVNFGADPSAIIVKVNGTKADVLTTTPNSVIAVAPTGATTGALTVTRHGATHGTNLEFTMLPLAIVSFSPATAFTGEVITIKGSGFSVGWPNNVVKISGVQASIASSNSNEIRVTVPAGATTGKVTVTTNQAATATSSENLVITPVAITTTTFPDVFSVGGPGVAASMSFTNAEQVSQIKFLSRGISQAGDFHEDNIGTSASGQVSFTIPPTYFNDPIGLQMEFVITDLDGNEISREGYGYKKFQEDDASQNIPGLTFGRGADNYHIIAIPLELSNRSVSNVFRQLEGFNQSRWRMYTYENQQTEELTTGDAAIYPGFGYWFISRNEVDINPGEGTTVRVTQSQPYVLKLKPGWNMIGNPYNFALSWDDVLSYNGSPPSIGNLRQFEGGEFSGSNKLDRFRGAFVRNGSEADVYVKIPVTNNSASRMGREEGDPRNWEIILSVTDGRISNSLGGFGMNVTASENTDRHDEVALPLPASMNSFELIMRKADEDIVKDIVPAGESYTWTGIVRSDDGVTLTWDNTSAQQLPHGLRMELPGHPVLIDMRSANSVKLPAGEVSFRIAYGNSDYIDHSTERSELMIGDVSPNPLPKNAAMLSLPVNLVSEESAIQLDIIDAKGTRTRHSFNGSCSRGRNIIQWQDDFLQLSPGLYLLSITIATQNTSQTFYRKFIIE